MFTVCVVTSKILLNCTNILFKLISWNASCKSLTNAPFKVTSNNKDGMGEINIVCFKYWKFSQESTEYNTSSCQSCLFCLEYPCHAFRETISLPIFIFPSGEMALMEKMAIWGIRSYNPDEPSIIEFQTPLTMIVGNNGSGKTVC